MIGQPGASPPTPRALLMDFGEVIVTSTHSGPGMESFVSYVAEMVDANAASAPTREAIRRDLQKGHERYRNWVDEETLRPSPVEMTPVDYWTNLVAPEWSTDARSAIQLHAQQLMDEYERCTEERKLLPGVREVLSFAKSKGIRLGLVSNTLSGTAFHETLDINGLAEIFDAEVYSSSANARKPNPSMFQQASQLLDVPLEDSWSVGDRYDMDVVGARRAGVGWVVLFQSLPVTLPPDALHRPDACLPDHRALLLSLTEAVSSGTTDRSRRS